jgi:hypothetical protein
MEQQLTNKTNSDVEYSSPGVETNTTKENNNSMNPPDEIFEDDLYIWSLLLLVDKKMD